MEGYCVKCKKKRTMKSPKTVTKNSRRFAMGICSSCGTRMSRILSNK